MKYLFMIRLVSKTLIWNSGYILLAIIIVKMHLIHLINGAVQVSRYFSYFVRTEYCFRNSLYKKVTAPWNYK